MNDSDLIPVTNLQPAPDQARENPMIWTGEEEAMGVFLNAGEADDALALLGMPALQRPATPRLPIDFTPGPLLRGRLEQLREAVKSAATGGEGQLLDMVELDADSRQALLEMLGGVALPAVLLSFRKFRNLPNGLLAASLLVMAGIVLNRVNVCWIGMSVSDELHYFPTWMEIALSLGFITAGTIIFFLAVHYLPVFPKTETEPALASPA